MDTCKECGSKDLSWFTANNINSSVQQGRLNTSDVSCNFFLGCNECSATLAAKSADQVAGEMNSHPSCPVQYEGQDGFFVYDFMPQRVMFKTLGNDQTAINVLQIRGWGYLTGQGNALKIPHDEAAKIQDQFGQWVADTLNKAL